VTGRKMTRLEGMLLGALVETLTKRPPEDGDLCHVGFYTAATCPRCSKILAAQALVARTLKRQRKKDPPRRAGGRRRRPAGGTFAERHDPLDQTLGEARREQDLVDYDGRGGKRVGERRQARRTMHIIDADSSSRDVELARSDLAEFFGDVLNKHHGGGF
jgi:hypothetical protein